MNKWIVIFLVVETIPLISLIIIQKFAFAGHILVDNFVSNEPKRYLWYLIHSFHHLCCHTYYITSGEAAHAAGPQFQKRASFWKKIWLGPGKADGIVVKFIPRLHIMCTVQFTDVKKNYKLTISYPSHKMRCRQFMRRPEPKWDHIFRECQTRWRP